jgi:hypothetical protein
MTAATHRTTAGQRYSLGKTLSRGYVRNEGLVCEETTGHGWNGSPRQMPSPVVLRDSEGVPLPEPSRVPLSPRVDNQTVGDVKQLKHMFETTRFSQIQPFKLPGTKVRNLVRKLEVTSSPLNDQEA